MAYAKEVGLCMYDMCLCFIWYDGVFVQELVWLYAL